MEKYRLCLGKRPVRVWGGEYWVCFPVLGCHPEWYRLWLWLCFSTRRGWRRAAIALCPAWGCGGRGNCPRVTWPWGFGSWVVFLFIRGVASVRHQTRFQSLHCKLWEKKMGNKQKTGRGGTFGEGREKNMGEKTHTPKITATTCFKYIKYKNTFRGKQIVNKFKIEFVSGVEKGSRHWKAAIGWWGPTVYRPTNRVEGRRHRMSRAPPPIRIQHHPRDTWKRRKTQRKREKHKNRRDSC